VKTWILSDRSRILAPATERDWQGRTVDGIGTINHLLQPPPKRTRPRRCSVEGCSKPTRENKPVCTDHVLELPYARRVAEMAQRIEKEHKMLLRGRRPNQEWLLVEDALISIAFQEEEEVPTVKICRTCDVPPKLALKLARAGGLSYRARRRSHVFNVKDARKIVIARIIGRDGPRARRS